jgi:hypothetical protein
MSQVPAKEKDCHEETKTPHTEMVMAGNAICSNNPLKSVFNIAQQTWVQVLFENISDTSSLLD